MVAGFITNVVRKRCGYCRGLIEPGGFTPSEIIEAEKVWFHDYCHDDWKEARKDDCCNATYGTSEQQV